MVDKHLFRTLTQFWNPAYSCFTFGRVDLVPTIEEYMALLQCSKIQADRAYSRAVNVPTFLKKLMNITGMSEQWVAVVFPKPWGTLIKRSPISLIDLIKGLHQSRQF
ncbi:hypothetical protein Gogos_020861 [Gossypium gossypioides]|uniref:DUF7745 domain-containing protein n=1 Tax=Gossypium gossypioides TaxID=34282 RepID=A0A7J9D1M3_GOSGO|nr:hypothetical protein [Gossypium gossypioides]